MLASFVLQGNKKYNEDACATMTIGNTQILMVADGHGHDGEGLECATYCIDQGQKQISVLLSSQLTADYTSWTREQWQEQTDRDMDELHNGYRVHCSSKPNRRVDGNVVRDMYGGAVHSGSTFTRVLVFPVDSGFRTVIAQVGDSDVYVNGECVSKDDSPLSAAHYQRIQSTIPENERLLQVYNISTNSFHKYTNPRVFLKDGTKDPVYEKNPWAYGLHPCSADYTPATFFVSQPHQRDETCIAMGSSIGDFYAHSQGLTNRCEVQLINTPKMPFIMVASDGAWDSLNKEKKWCTPRKGDCGGVLRLQEKCMSSVEVQGEVEKHVRLVREIGCELFGKGGVDDISVAVLLP